MRSHVLMASAVAAAAMLLLLLLPSGPLPAEGAPAPAACEHCKNLGEACQLHTTSECKKDLKCHKQLHVCCLGSNCGGGGGGGSGSGSGSRGTTSGGSSQQSDGEGETEVSTTTNSTTSSSTGGSRTTGSSTTVGSTGSSTTGGSSPSSGRCGFHPVHCKDLGEHCTPRQVSECARGTCNKQLLVCCDGDDCGQGQGQGPDEGDGSGEEGRRRRLLLGQQAAAPTYGHHRKLLLPVAAAAPSSSSSSSGSGSRGRALLGGGYDMCGAGPVFHDVNCRYAANAKDLRQSTVKAASSTCANYIQCGGGSAELYRLEVDTWAGKDVYTGRDKYYAHARAVHMRSGEEVGYCWKRDDAGGDGCGCICAVVLAGSSLGQRPECQCKF